MSKNNARLRGFWAPPAPQPGLVLAAQISSPSQMVGVMESTSLLCKEARQAHTGSFPNRSGALGQPPSHQAALTSHNAHPNPRTQAGPSVLASHQPHHSKNTSHALISSSLTQVETNSNCLQRTELNAWAGGRTRGCCRVWAHSTAPRPPQPQLLTSKPLPAGLDLALAVPCRTPGRSRDLSRAPEEPGAPASRPYPQHPAAALHQGCSRPGRCPAWLRLLLSSPLCSRGRHRGLRTGISPPPSQS